MLQALVNFQTTNCARNHVITFLDYDDCYYYTSDSLSLVFLGKTFDRWGILGNLIKKKMEHYSLRPSQKHENREIILLLKCT